MELMKTPSPSVQSLVDSDVGSIESLQSLDIEELDEAEYGLPVTEHAPSLAEILSEEQPISDPAECSSLRAELLQAVSQQLISAQERSAAGAATTLTLGVSGKLAVGTAHGHLLAFQGQTLRWANITNSDKGAVACLAYNYDSTRLLAGYATGLICQFESCHGIALRKVVPGGGVWGALRVTWAGAAALALDTGGSVWLLKFSRPLGVRSARVSCLFSGARGEVVAMAARDAGVLALATLSRVILVAGGRAAAVRLTGPADTLPALAWSEGEERVLVCARGKSLQWLAVSVAGASVSLKPLRVVELKAAPLWLGFLSGKLAILDVAEQLRLWEDSDEPPLDLTMFQLVYASAFFKGVFTDGRVSAALSRAGAGALGGACADDGGLTLLGAAGVVRVRPRDVLQRARALADAGRAARALRLLHTAGTQDARALAAAFVRELADRPAALHERGVAAAAVTLCLRNGLESELWGTLWEKCRSERPLVEAVGAAAAAGEVRPQQAPAPDVTHALLERLADVAPDALERCLVRLPLTAIDPHGATVLVRARGLWRAAAALAGVLGGGAGAALRDLTPDVRRCRAGGRPGPCACAGDALLVCAADGLGGRGPGGVRLPDHAQPAARAETLRVLLEGGDAAPLRALLRHDAPSVVRMLNMSGRDPPFVGPLGKQNRLRIARALLDWTQDLEDVDRLEVLQLVTGQLNSSALPPDRELVRSARALLSSLRGEPADRAWLALLERPHTRGDLSEQLEAVAERPRVRWHVLDMLGRHPEAIDTLFSIDTLSRADVDDLFEYLNRRAADKSEDISEALCKHARRVVEARPRAAAALLSQAWPACVTDALETARPHHAMQFAESLLDIGALSERAARVHLRNLCRHAPHAAVEFLRTHPDAVRAEEALLVASECGARAALPACLEAAGRPEEAVRAAVELVADASDDSEKESLMAAACELCSRLAPAVSAEVGGRMWSAVLAHAKLVPAVAMMEAISYVPVESIVERACAVSPQVGLALCGRAAARRDAEASAARIAARELHEKLARHVRVAGRALAVRGASCVGCKRALSVATTRAFPCGHASHADCGARTQCVACGLRVADEVRLAASVAPRQTDAPPSTFELQVAAPPRPDLEGIV